MVRDQLPVQEVKFNAGTTCIYSKMKLSVEGNHSILTITYQRSNGVVGKKEQLFLQFRTAKLESWPSEMY